MTVKINSFPIFVKIKDEKRIEEDKTLGPLVKEFRALQTACAEHYEDTAAVKEWISAYKGKFANLDKKDEHFLSKQKIKHAVMKFEICLFPPSKVPEGMPFTREEIATKYQPTYKPTIGTILAGVEVSYKIAVALFNKIYTTRQIEQTEIDKLDKQIIKIYKNTNGLYGEDPKDELFKFLFDVAMGLTIRWDHFHLKTSLDRKRKNIAFPSIADSEMTDDHRKVFKEVSRIFKDLKSDLELLTSRTLKTKKHFRESTYSNMERKIKNLESIFEKFPNDDAIIVACRKTISEINSFIKACQTEYGDTKAPEVVYHEEIKKD